MNFNASALALNQQNLIAPQSGGGTLGFSLGTASTQVLSANPQVRKVTFANPSQVTMYVCQALDANGNALTAGPNPGNWPILPGAIWSYEGNGVAGAWLAAAATGSGNALTVAASQTL